jgi:ABC-2 type transport system permease protein
VNAVPGEGAPTSATAPPAAARATAWGPLRREWIKLLFQRRSYLIWAGWALIPFLISLAVKLAGSANNGGDQGGPQFLDRIFNNGMYVALASVAAMLPFLLPMAAAMVAGYMIAGEAELGTLRIILLRPVRRGALLGVKWSAAMVYLVVGVVFMLASGLLFGELFFGLKPMVLLSGTTVSVAHGLWLILLACLYGLAAMSVIVSLALLISVISDSSLTALITTIAIYIIIQIVIAFSYFAWLRPWMFPAYFEGFINLLRDPIYWRPILKGLLAFALWDGAFMALAYVLFRRKDVLS